MADRSNRNYGSLRSLMSLVSLRIVPNLPNLPNLPKFPTLPNLSFLTFHLSVFSFHLSPFLFALLALQFLPTAALPPQRSCRATNITTPTNLSTEAHQAQSPTTTLNRNPSAIVVFQSPPTVVQSPPHPNPQPHPSIETHLRWLNNC